MASCSPAAGVNATPRPTADGIERVAKQRALTASSVVWSFLLFDAAILSVAGGHSLIGSPSGTVTALFELGDEPTIPAWYASSKLLLVAGLLAALALSARADSKQKWGLTAAALLFLVMSCDESAAMHERIQRGIDTHVLAGLTTDVYDSTVLAKVVLGLAALAVVASAVFMVASALRRFGAGKAAFGLGFLLLAAGAVGVDLSQEFFPSSGAEATLAIVLEEALEMVGVTLMVYGALQALAVAPVVLHLGARLHARPADRPD